MLLRVPALSTHLLCLPLIWNSVIPPIITRPIAPSINSNWIVNMKINYIDKAAPVFDRISYRLLEGLFPRTVYPCSSIVVNANTINCVVNIILLLLYFVTRDNPTHRLKSKIAWHSIQSGYLLYNLLSAAHWTIHRNINIKNKRYQKHLSA